MRCGVVLAALAGFASAQAQPLTDAERARVEAVFDGLMEDGGPGYAVGVVRDGQSVFFAYGGLAEVSHSVPIGPETRINVASVAKQYVALMVLDLAEQGRVDLKADFRTYLTDAMPKVKETVTVTHLLTHTSGVRDQNSLWALTGVTWYERPHNNGTAMRLLNAQGSLNFEPGSQFLYSNANYILLAELVEAVSGERVDIYARGFFDAIGMESSGYKRRYGLALPNEAKGYMYYDGWIANPQIANFFGDGFLYTTLPDQMAYEAQLQGEPSALPPSVIAKSQTRPDPTLPGGYGFGLEFDTFLKAPAIYHVGSTGGYNAYTLRLPEIETAIVVMLNTSRIGSVGLGQRVAAALLDVPVEAIGDYPAGPETLLARPENAAVLGRYELDSGTIVTITQDEEGVLYREIEGSQPAALLHREGNVFEYSTIPGLRIAFDNAEDGTRRFRLFMATQGTQTALERPAPPTDAASKTSLEGCYYNAETRTEIVMEWAGDQNFRFIKNGRSREAVMVSADEVRWNGYKLRFERGDAGEVSRLWVDRDRIRNVRFELWDQCRGESLGRFSPL